MTDDWAGRDDDGDGIPNALDADPAVPDRSAGWSVTEDVPLTPADAPIGGVTPPSAPAAAPMAPLPPMPEQPVAPAPDADPATLQEYQAEVQRYQMLMETYSNVLKEMNEAQRDIAKNLGG